MKPLEVHLYSHFFKVKPQSEKERKLCIQFAHRYITHQLQPAGGGRMERKVDKVYAASNTSRTEFRFHFNALEDWKDFLKANNYNQEQVVYIEHPFTPKHPVEIDIKVKPGWEPRDYQVPVIEYIKDVKIKPNKLITLATGQGKSLLNQELIKTPTGWVMNKDITVGSYVTGRDGKPAEVTGVYPQGKLAEYMLVTSDGRTLISSADHQWTVSEGNSKELFVTTTADMYESYLYGNGEAYQFYLPLISPKAGNTENNNLEQRVRRLRELVQAHPPLTGKRLMVLLKDMKDVETYRYLVHSLGGISKLTYQDSAQGGFHWAETRYLPDEVISLLDLPFENSVEGKLGVKTIFKTGKETEMQCISIDHPEHLYIAGDHLATHNTFCAMQSAADIKMRTLFMLRPAFMDKWVEDLLKTYVIKPEDIAVVKGGAQLMALFAMFNNPRLKESDLPKFIILSNKTYQLYLKNYEQYGEEILEQGYDCLPEDMYEHLGVGIRFIDEVHLDFHLNFKADLYTNIPYTASMTASLITSDPELSRMYFTAYPTNQRYKAPPPKRYIEARGLLYRTSEKEQPRISWPNRKDYAHGAYEQWLMKRPGSLKRYFEMIKHVIDGEYIENYREGDRLLVFCYSIKMATLLSDFLAETYPQHSVKRYVEDDEYNNVLEPDMRVSTVLSAGTGIDIPKLRLAILTTAINSEKSNIQSLGRLRELKDDDRPPVFYWFTNERIPKHVYYHRAKKELFQPLTKSVADRYYDKEI